MILSILRIRSISIRKTCRKKSMHRKDAGCLLRGRYWLNLISFLFACQMQKPAERHALSRFYITEVGLFNLLNRFGKYCSLGFVSISASCFSIFNITRPASACPSPAASASASLSGRRLHLPVLIILGSRKIRRTHLFSSSCCMKICGEKC